MTGADPVLVGMIVAGLAAVVLQVSDAAGALIDASTVRDSDDPDALTRRRGRELFWALALTATLAVLIAYGVDRAARLAAGPGVGVLLLTTVAAFLVGCVGVLAVLRRERPTYARLRRDLRDRSTFTVDADELRDFEVRLERADRVRSRRPTAVFALRLLGVVLIAVATALVASEDAALLPIALVGVAAHLVAVVIALRASATHRRRLEAPRSSGRRRGRVAARRGRVDARTRPNPSARQRSGVARPGNPCARDPAREATLMADRL